MPLHFQYLFPPGYCLQSKQSGQGNQMVCWLVGALLVKKQTLIIHRRSSLGSKAPLWGHPLHEVKEESTRQPLLPRKPPCPSQDVYHRNILPSAPRVTLLHFFPGLSLFLFLFSVLCTQDSQVPSQRHPSDFALTPLLWPLFISLIPGFVILTLHQSVYLLLTQPFCNAISILRSIAPPKDL